MSSSRINYVKNLFSKYAEYLQTDLANSLSNNNKYYRNVDVIVVLKDIFNIFFQSDEILKKKEDKLDSMFKILDNVIKGYSSINKIELDIEKFKKCDDSLISKILEDEHLIKLIANFVKANRLFRNFFNGEYIEQKILKKFSNGTATYDCYLFVQPILEANNALSHLAVYIYNGSIETEVEELKNIDKAKSHFYRGLIDYYKIFIRFSIEKVSNKREDIFKSFRSIREQEFLLLGKNLMEKYIEFFDVETGKNETGYIFEAYRRLFITIKKDLDLQKK